MESSNPSVRKNVAKSPFPTVTAAFHHQVKASATSLAVRDLSETPRELTYGALAQRIQILAQYLHDEGVLPGQRVPFVANRGLDMIIGIWAILCCGAQYILLDSQVVSDETLCHVLRESQASIVLCLSSTQHRVLKLQTSCTVVLVDDEKMKSSERPCDEFMDLATPEGGCYATCTSGGFQIEDFPTTKGPSLIQSVRDIDKLPLGVDVTHENVTNLVCLSPGNLGICPGTNVGQVLDIEVESAAWEIFACQCNGGTLVLRGSTWESALQEIDVLVCSPTILSTYRAGQFPRIKTVAAIGERSTNELADAWANHTIFWDCWGSAEITMVSTMRKHALGTNVSLGEPIPNTSVYVLDSEDQPIQKGDTGVIWVGGKGVSRGYRGDHTATVERYKLDPFADDGSRMFKTRDLGGFRADGTIEILPRIDHDINISGDIEAGRSELKSQSSLSSLSTLTEKWDLAQELPNKELAQPFRGLKYRIFIVYRTLFSLVGILNLAAFISVLVRRPASQWLGTITAINLTMAVLVRQDSVINGLYTISCSMPKRMPLWVRLRCANIYHLGGVHSGAGVCATAWLVISTIKSTVCTATFCRDERMQSNATQVVSWLLCGLCCLMVGFAWPSFRKNHHNFFERFHRFAGWTTLGLFWVRIMLVIDDSRPKGQSFGLVMARNPDFWLLVAVTCSIASSWLYLRKVPVEAEVLSDHAVRLHFDYAVPVNGSFTRVSRRPLIEWHSFATIAAPEPTNHPRGYSMVVSNAGDWTRACIQKPPTKIWVRGVPTCGVMRIAPLFNRIVIIATGSGIGPMLGHITHQPCPLQLIWSAPRPEVTFGKEIVGAIREKLPDAVIHDTKLQGRPDLVRMGFNLAQSFQAEAVLIIANEKITKKVVYGIESRGIPAFGAIWDS